MSGACFDVTVIREVPSLSCDGEDSGELENIYGSRCNLVFTSIYCPQ